MLPGKSGSRLLAKRLLGKNGSNLGIGAAVVTIKAGVAIRAGAMPGPMLAHYSNCDGNGDGDTMMTMTITMMMVTVTVMTAVIAPSEARKKRKERAYVCVGLRACLCPHAVYARKVKAQGDLGQGAAHRRSTVHRPHAT
jgi:hypothetical protein